jgi:hypothetical protein
MPCNLRESASRAFSSFSCLFCPYFASPRLTDAITTQIATHSVAFPVKSCTRRIRLAATTVPVSAESSSRGPGCCITVYNWGFFPPLSSPIRRPHTSTLSQEGRLLYNKVRSKTYSSDYDAPSQPAQVGHVRLRVVRRVVLRTSFCPAVHDRLPDFLVLVLSDPELRHHRKDIKIGQLLSVSAKI